MRIIADEKNPSMVSSCTKLPEINMRLPTVLPFDDRRIELNQGNAFPFSYEIDCGIWIGRSSLWRRNGERARQQGRQGLYSRRLIHKGTRCSTDNEIMGLSAEGRELSFSTGPRLCTTQGIFRQDLMDGMPATTEVHARSAPSSYSSLNPCRRVKPLRRYSPPVRQCSLWHITLYSDIVFDRYPLSSRDRI